MQCSGRPKGTVGAPRVSASGKEAVMFYWAIAFFLVALVAGFFGFFGIAASAAGIAKIIFVVALIMAIFTFVFGRRRSARL